MNRVRIRPREQRGAVLLAVLILVVVAGIAGLFAAGDPVGAARAHAQARTSTALAQARAALLGYAVSYAEHHPGQGYGYLPCPDSGNTGSAAIGACQIRDHGALGRLPYRTLGLADLRDGHGDCLWYAVAGSVKNNPKPVALNWDSPGQFELTDRRGTALIPSAARVVAVVAAPGPARPAQTRPPPGTQRCPGSHDAAIDLPQFLDDSYTVGISATRTFIQGLADDADNNDLFTWLTVDDIFDALRRRADFPGLIDVMLDRAALSLGAHLGDPNFLSVHAGPALGIRVSGRLPDAAALGLLAPFDAMHDNWREQSWFLACTDGSACLDANLVDSALSPINSATESCRGLLLFGGERIRNGPTAQSRSTPAERADAAQYFEGANLASLVQGSGDFGGYRHFTSPHPHLPATGDVVKCIP